MRKIIFLGISAFLMISCASIQVNTDYDTNANFDKYKTFAFYKPGIDKAEISDIDKKRVLRALEAALESQGYLKSENPDMLVSFFTKARTKVDVNQNNMGMGYGFGWGWNPWMWNGMNNNVNVSEYTEGTLFIDFIDRDKKELFWQGIGTGALRIENADEKEVRIQEFVGEIISRFPPEEKKKK